jgi:hypothetical protein
MNSQITTKEDAWWDSFAWIAVRCKAAPYAGQHKHGRNAVALEHAVPVNKRAQTFRALDRAARLIRLMTSINSES